MKGDAFLPHFPHSLKEFGPVLRNPGVSTVLGEFTCEFEDQSFGEERSARRGCRVDW